MDKIQIEQLKIIINIVDLDSTRYNTNENTLQYQNAFIEIFR